MPPDIAVVENMLDVDLDSLPLHRGHFLEEVVKAFKEIPGLKVLGESERSIAYFVQNDKLIALSMPLMVQPGSKYDRADLQFN